MSAADGRTAAGPGREPGGQRLVNPLTIVRLACAECRLPATSELARSDDHEQAEFGSGGESLRVDEAIELCVDAPTDRRQPRSTLRGERPSCSSIMAEYPNRQVASSAGWGRVINVSSGGVRVVPRRGLVRDEQVRGRVLLPRCGLGTWRAAEVQRAGSRSEMNFNIADSGSP